MKLPICSAFVLLALEARQGTNYFLKKSSSMVLEEFMSFV
jgi:hypothetical protein